MAALVFTGGTSLAKVHSAFYRLSEDLDFVIPTPQEASQGERRRRAGGAKATVTASAWLLPGTHVVQDLSGANSSRQYSGVIGYTSLLNQEAATVKIDLGLREDLLLPLIRGPAKTLLLHPVSGLPQVPPLPVACLSRQEAMAEKVRAALSRREVAVRDFFDVDFAVRNLSFRPSDPAILRLIRKKLAVPGNSTVDMGPERLAALRAQVDTQLKPVLRSQDFAEFSLGRAFAAVSEVAALLSA